MAEPAVIVFGASRPLPGERENGDAWMVDRPGGGWRIVVVDGLGHGAGAAVAARAALEAVRAAPSDPVGALRACHAALRGTRGAVAAITWIAPDGARLVHAGVGNVDAALWHGGRLERLISYRGTLGAAIRTVRAFTLVPTPPWLLFLHSDGISARVDPAALIAEIGPRPEALAAAVLGRWARPTDDATIVVAAFDRPPA